MHKEIKKAGRDAIVAALKSRDYVKIKRINQVAAEDAREVFDAVASGSVPIAWYDMSPITTRSGAVSVMRYALHRSPKKNGLLQLSCMELKNDQAIPISDLQFNIANGFQDFFRELPANTVINF